MIVILAISILCALTLWDTFWGLCFLLAGFCAFNRAFSYIHITIHSLPIFVAEIYLSFSLLKMIFSKTGRHSLRSIVCTWPWILFAIAASSSLIRGVHTYMLADVLRDSALAYYSLFTVVILGMRIDLERIKTASWILFSIILVKAVAVLIAPYFRQQGIRLILVDENPAAIAMYISMALLGWAAYWPWHRSKIAWTACGSFLVCASLSLMVRSSWTGYVAGLLALLFCLWFNNRTIAYRWSIAHVILGVSGMSLLWLISKSPFGFERMPGIVLTEARSFSLGSNADNVKTRFYLWEDAIGEVFSSGLFSKHLHVEDLKEYNLPETVVDNVKTSVNIRIGAEGHRREEVVLPLENKNAPIATTSREDLTRIEKVFLGIPFGKPFFPPQVIYWLESTKRYDPHNSQIAILYRMGVLGLFAFIAILFQTFSRLISIYRRVRTDLPAVTWIAALLALLCYHQVHSLTDVTMENAFKGIMLWVIIGLAAHPAIRCLGLSETPSKTLPLP
jgi:hypothetical protein